MINPILKPNRSKAWAQRILGLAVTLIYPFSLDAIAGGISGRVSEAGGGPLGGIGVTAHFPSGDGWDRAAATVTGADGTYRLDGLAAGAYRVCFEDWGSGLYARQCYSDATGIDGGDDIAVTDDATISDIDATLSQAAVITGRVADIWGVTIAGARVAAGIWDDADGWFREIASSESGAGGEYAISGLASGNYRVCATHPNFVGACNGGASKPAVAGDLAVQAGSATADVNIALPIAGHISGRVENAAGAAIEGIEAIAFVRASEDEAEWWQPAATALTGTSGAYEINSLPGGRYKVCFEDPSGLGYLPSCFPDANDIETAEEIEVVVAQTSSDIDAQLTKAGAIAGRLTSVNDGPLAGVEIFAYQSVDDGSQQWWSIADKAITDPDGRYGIANLRPGTYRICANDHQDEYANDCYDGAPNVSTGTDVEVAAGNTTRSIDVGLLPRGDADGDGIVDNQDNCPFQPNRDQANHDRDEHGDACDPDDDNDGVEDAQDSAPLDETNSGPVLAVPTDTLDTSEHGNIWGDDAYYTVLTAIVSTDGTDKLLHVQGYDIDKADEVGLYLNEELLGYLTPGPNNGLNAPSLWWLPAEKLIDGDNRITLVQTYPGYIWGATALGLFQPGNQTLSAFGNLKSLTDGDVTHAQGFELHLPYDSLTAPRGLLLELTGYDADWGDEIGLDLEGSPLTDLPAGVNSDWGKTHHLVIPSAWLAEGDNLLAIGNRISDNYDWGVRFERLLPVGAELGHHLPGQTSAAQRPDAVHYLIPPLADNALLELRYFDVDFADELELLHDGASLGYAATTANNAWSPNPTALALPANVPAVITVDNAYNPPQGFIWGVRMEGLE